MLVVKSSSGPPISFVIPSGSTENRASPDATSVSKGRIPVVPATAVFADSKAALAIVVARPAGSVLVCSAQNRQSIANCYWRTRLICLWWRDWCCCYCKPLPLKDPPSTQPCVININQLSENFQLSKNASQFAASK